eukprot:m51a1_g10960 hypothetical protein (132) ;mRNA; r:218589-219155
MSALSLPPDTKRPASIDGMYTALIATNYAKFMSHSPAVPACSVGRRWLLTEMKPGLFLELKGKEGWVLIYERRYRSRRLGGELFVLQRFIPIKGLLHPTDLWDYEGLKWLHNGTPRAVSWGAQHGGISPLY